LSIHIEGLDVAEAMQRLLNNEDLFLRVLQGYLDEYETKRPMIKASLIEGDLSQARELIHSLKGISSNLSAHEASRLCLEMEMGCKAGNLDQTQALFQVFEVVMNKIRQDSLPLLAS